MSRWPRTTPRPLPAERHQCSVCPARETTDGNLPVGWELRAVGDSHVLVCAACIPDWEQRPRGSTPADDTDFPTLLLVSESGMAWIGVDLGDPGTDQTSGYALIRAKDGRLAKPWRIHAGARVSHWPMPELGGSAIMITDEEGAEGVLFTADGHTLDKIIGRLVEIRTEMAGGL